MRIRFREMQEKHFRYGKCKEGNRKMYFVNFFGLGIMVTNF